MIAHDGESKNEAAVNWGDAKVPCLVCGDKRNGLPAWGRYENDERVENVICRNCGLVYTNPQPSEKKLSKYYEDEYRRQYSRSAVPTEEFFAACERYAEGRFRALSEHFSNPTGKKVLEIGSGCGSFLGELKKQWPGLGALVGIEPNVNYSSHGSRRYQVKIINGMFGSARIEEAPFDLICFFHVFEHIANPCDFLENVRSLLNPGGMLFIEVPNVARPYSGHFDRFFQKAHLAHYSPQTLRKLLYKAGFNPTHEFPLFGFWSMVAKADDGARNLYMSCTTPSALAVKRMLALWRIYFYVWGYLGDYFFPEIYAKYRRGVRKIKRMLNEK